MAAARFLIAGRVQGVFFRASTREQAQRLHLCGSACNRPDGTVEVIAAGNAEALQRLAEWLQHGPPAARVEQVWREEWDAPVMDGFRIG